MKRAVFALAYVPYPLVEEKYSLVTDMMGLGHDTARVL
jgi:hypothetical protein